MRQVLTIILMSAFISAAAGCSLSPRSEYGAAGGAGGAALGAGTGAAIGAAIANGDVAASALLGGAIGLPVGILAGVAYYDYKVESELRERDERILANQRELMIRQHEINETNNRLREEASAVEPDHDSAEYRYTGPRLRSPY